MVEDMVAWATAGMAATEATACRWRPVALVLAEAYCSEALLVSAMPCRHVRTDGTLQVEVGMVDLAVDSVVVGSMGEEEASQVLRVAIWAAALVGLCNKRPMSWRDPLLSEILKWCRRYLGRIGSNLGQRQRHVFWCAQFSLSQRWKHIEHYSELQRCIQGSRQDHYVEYGIR